MNIWLNKLLRKWSRKLCYNMVSVTTDPKEIAALSKFCLENKLYTHETHMAYKMFQTPEKIFKIAMINGIAWGFKEAEANRYQYYTHPDHRNLGYAYAIWKKLTNDN